MKHKQSVRTGKYKAVCLLVMLVLLLAGCSDGTAGGIDPNAIEHNPNHAVSLLPSDEQGSSEGAGAESNRNQENGLPGDGSPQSGTEAGEINGSGGVDGNNENKGNIGTVDNNENTGTDLGTDKPDAEKNSGNAGDAGTPDDAANAEPEYVVVLDPGHGGQFSGAVHGLVEKDTVLKIALYAKAYLEEHYPQIEVKMTRETDKDFDSQLAKDLENRVQLGKEMGADVFVSLHLNASTAHNIRGAEVICPHREHVKTESFLLANCILDELTALGIKRRGIVTKNSNDMVDANGNPLEYYAINRHAANRDMVGIIVEHCFMDNEEDKLFLADEAALQRLGEADARGIAAYFGY